MVQLYGCQQHLIKDSEEVMAILELICSESNKLTNCGIYYCRQMLFKANHFVTRSELDDQLKTNPHFKAMRSACAQQGLHRVVESFTSYKRLSKLYREGKLHFQPRLPNYRKKGGYSVVTYPARWVKLIDGKLTLRLRSGLTSSGVEMLRFSLGNQVKAWFGIESFLLPMPSNLDFQSIQEYRIVPRNNCFYIEFVYQKPKKLSVQSNQNVLGIDPGLENWLTCVSNTGKSFIIEGQKVKSQNQWYNKQVARLKTGRPGDYWDEQLASITEKRNRQMRDHINKAARFVMNWCLANDVTNIVFGWNKFNKDGAECTPLSTSNAFEVGRGINIGKKNNQNFVQVPTSRLRNRIAQLCEEYGIKFIETEESYTSKTSFLDDDLLPTFGEKPVGEASLKGLGWTSLGKRVARGLYRSADGSLINADCNGAANIVKKVATRLGFDLARVGRACLTAPKRYGKDSLSKSYRKRCGAWLSLTAGFRQQPA